MNCLMDRAKDCDFRYNIYWTAVELFMVALLLSLTAAAGGCLKSFPFDDRCFVGSQHKHTDSTKRNSGETMPFTPRASPFRRRTNKRSRS